MMFQRATDSLSEGLQRGPLRHQQTSKCHGPQLLLCHMTEIVRCQSLWGERRNLLKGEGGGGGGWGGVRKSERVLESKGKMERRKK